MEESDSKKSMNEDLPLFNDIIHMSDRSEFFLSSSDAMDIGELIENDSSHLSGILSKERESPFSKSEISNFKHSKKSQSMEFFSNFNANEDDWLYAPDTETKDVFKPVSANRTMQFSKELEPSSFDGINSNKFGTDELFSIPRSMAGTSVDELSMDFLNTKSAFPLLKTPSLSHKSNLEYSNLSQPSFSVEKASHPHSKTHPQFQYKPLSSSQPRASQSQSRTQLHSQFRPQTQTQTQPSSKILLQSQMHVQNSALSSTQSTSHFLAVSHSQPTVPIPIQPRPMAQHEFTHISNNADESVPPNLITKLDLSKSQMPSKTSSVSTLDSNKSNLTNAGKPQKSVTSNSVFSSESSSKKTKVLNSSSLRLTHPNSSFLSSSPLASTLIPSKVQPIISPNLKNNVYNNTQISPTPAIASKDPSPAEPKIKTSPVSQSPPQVSSILSTPRYPTASSDLPGLSGDTPPNLRTMNVRLTSPISSKQEPKTNNSGLKKGLTSSKSTDSLKKSSNHPTYAHKSEFHLSLNPDSKRNRSNSNASLSHSYSHSYSSPSLSSYSSFSGNASFISKPKIPHDSFSSAFNSSSSRTLRFHETKSIEDKSNSLLTQETKSSSISHILPSPSKSLTLNESPLETANIDEKSNSQSTSSPFPGTSQILPSPSISSSSVKLVEKINETGHGGRLKKKKKSKISVENKNDDVYFDGASSNSPMSSPDQFASTSVYQKRHKKNSKRKSKRSEKNQGMSSEENSSWNMDGSEQDAEERRKDSEDTSSMEAEEGALADIESDYSREGKTLKGLKDHNWNRTSKLKNEILKEDEKEGDEESSKDEEESDDEDEDEDENEESEDEEPDKVEKRKSVSYPEFEKEKETKEGISNSDNKSRGNEAMGDKEEKTTHFVNVDPIVQVEPKNDTENENSISKASCSSLSSSQSMIIPAASLEPKEATASSFSSDASSFSFSKGDDFKNGDSLKSKELTAETNITNNSSSKIKGEPSESCANSHSTEVDTNTPSTSDVNSVKTNVINTTGDTSSSVLVKKNVLENHQMGLNEMKEGKEKRDDTNSNENSNKRSKESSESLKIWLDEEELYGDLVGQVKAQIEGWKREDSSIDEQSFHKLQNVTLNNGKISFPDVPHTFSENSSNILSLHSAHFGKKDLISLSMGENTPSRSNSLKSSEISPVKTSKQAGYDENTTSSSSSSHRLKFSSTLPQSFTSSCFSPSTSSSAIHGGGHLQENVLRKSAHNFNKEMMLLNRMNTGLKSFSSDAFDWDKCSSLDETYSDISTPSTMLSRNMTIEEATEIVLFCSSIVHDLIYKAATISENRHTSSSSVTSSPSVTPQTKRSPNFNVSNEVQRSMNSPNLKAKRFDLACTVISEKNENLDCMDEKTHVNENEKVDEPVDFVRNSSIKTSTNGIAQHRQRAVPNCGCVIL